MRTVLFGGGVEMTGGLGERLKVRKESVGKHRCSKCALTLCLRSKMESSKGGEGFLLPKFSLRWLHNIQIKMTFR